MLNTLLFFEGIDQVTTLHHQKVKMCKWYGTHTAERSSKSCLPVFFCSFPFKGTLNTTAGRGTRNVNPPPAEIGYLQSGALLSVHCPLERGINWNWNWKVKRSSSELQLNLLASGKVPPTASLRWASHVSEPADLPGSVQTMPSGAAPDIERHDDYLPPSPPLPHHHHHCPWGQSMGRAAAPSGPRDFRDSPLLRRPAVSCGRSSSADKNPIWRKNWCAVRLAGRSPSHDSTLQTWGRRGDSEPGVVHRVIQGV